MQPLFKRFIEPGRLCLVQYGPDEGKLCFIVDIINSTRVLVDGAGVTEVKRQAIPVRRIALTDFVVKFPRGARSSTIKRKVEEQASKGGDSDVITKFFNSSWGKRLRSREQKRKLTDFERFKVMCAKMQRAKAVRKAIGKH